MWQGVDEKGHYYLKTMYHSSQNCYLLLFHICMVFFLSSSSIQTLDCWTHAHSYQNGMWGRGAYAMHIGLQNDQENQDLKGDDISMLLFIKTLFSNKKNCFV